MQAALERLERLGRSVGAGRGDQRQASGRQLGDALGDGAGRRAVGGAAGRRGDRLALQEPLGGDDGGLCDLLVGSVRCV